MFWVLIALCAGSAITILWRVNNAFLVATPRSGGSFTEGVIGLPRFINPVLAVTDGDKDIAALVYSGLMRRSADGTLVPDLAESYTISADGRIYTFTIKSNAVFHDGIPVTADDVEYTIKTIQNPAVQSVEFANWAGVTVEKMDSRHIRFVLRQPYAPFLENMTIGILPKHGWTGINASDFSLSDRNMNPIGAGPYKISSIKKTASGIPTAYVLAPFKKHASLQPKIQEITIEFYANELALVEAYHNGDIDSLNGISPGNASVIEKSNTFVTESTLPRIFGVFFNQSENTALAENAVRQALNMSVDKPHIINAVLLGYGEPLNGPVPNEFVAIDTGTNTPSHDESIAQAVALLEKNGWVTNAAGVREKKTKQGTTTLSFSISTSDALELKSVAAILQEEWKRIGADVSIKIFEGGHLNQDIIHPRRYEALLFGQVVNRDLDLYAFWHSAARTESGLNVALYNNPAADKLLEEMRTTADKTLRQADYQKFAAMLSRDVPAVFLYSPNFIYIPPRHVRNVSLKAIAGPSDRFSQVSDWYIETDKLWRIFVKN